MMARALCKKGAFLGGSSRGPFSPVMNPLNITMIHQYTSGCEGYIYYGID